MINGQILSGSDMEALIDEAGEIRILSGASTLLEHEQLIDLPNTKLAIACPKKTPEATVKALAEGFMAIYGAPSSAIMLSEQAQQDNADMERLAMQDPLTELPNRRKLFDFLNDILSQPNQDTNVAILQIDLDKFKQINDSLGHAAGDQVLMVVAHRLRASVRPNDLVARIGGDEFVIACPSVTNFETASELAARLVSSLSQPVKLQGRLYQIGASIGIAFREPNQPMDSDTLLQNADLALYTCKENGRNQFRLYDPSMRNRFETIQSLKKELSEACDNGSIVAHFQPTFCLQSDMVAGVQAMARWQHSTFGLLTYGEFERHADDQVLHRIDQEMLDQCLSGICLLSTKNSNVSKFSITASTIRLRDPEFVNSLQEAIGLKGLNTDQVSIEIIETGEALWDDHSLQHLLNELRIAGFGLCLSNYGGPRSSLQNLLNFSPDCIKLYGGLSRELLHNVKKQRLLSGVISMAEKLNIAVVATSIEAQSDRNILRQLGCGFIQGNIMYPPTDIDTLAEWLDNNSGDSSQAA